MNDYIRCPKCGSRLYNVFDCETEFYDDNCTYVLEWRTCMNCDHEYHVRAKFVFDGEELVGMKMKTKGGKFLTAWDCDCPKYVHHKNKYLRKMKRFARRMDRRVLNEGI